MDHKEKLIEIHNSSFSIDDIKNIPEKYRDYVNIIGNKVCEQKGVYTVLITLLVHKSLFPAQDIRKHQEKMDGGFSGRTVDTKFITPTLKELGLPSMAESAWLTRSLEQPYPYTLDYLGNIRDVEVKQSFLNIIDYVENNPKKVEEILRLILYAVIQTTSKQLIQVTKLTNPDYLTILSIIQALEEHFDTKYKVRGASKLPVLAIYAMYNSLVKDIIPNPVIKRY
jgi:DNA (cytosine-5)-methyltransferase 1